MAVSACRQLCPISKGASVMPINRIRKAKTIQNRTSLARRENSDDSPALNPEFEELDFIGL